MHTNEGGLEGNARGWHNGLTSVFSWILSPRLFSALMGAKTLALRSVGRQGANAATFPRCARIVMVDMAMTEIFL